MDDQKTSSKELNIMALLSYIGILCLIPLLTKPQDEFVKFHLKQGLVIFIGEIATMFLFWILAFLFPLWWLLNLGWFILSIVGIVNVVKNEQKPVPFVGKYADKIKI
jgi:fumarate reductase subunit D